MSTTTPAGNELDLLTDQQRHAFELIAKGYTVKEAAKFMGVADDTVSAQVVRAHKKTGLTTMEIVVLMAKAGWV